MGDGPARNLGQFPFAGSFDWSIGIVVDNKDIDKSGHYKVRILGLQDGVPVDKLSWIPNFTGGAAHQKVGFSPTGFLIGSHVHVKFGNPSDATNPMIMGIALNTAGDPQDGTTIDGQQAIKPETNSVAMEARGVDKAAWIKGSPPTTEDAPNSKDDDPQHVNSVQYAQDEKNGSAKQPKAKTIGTEAIAGSILNLIQNMDGNASGAIQNAVQGLIKIKTINDLTSTSGLNNMLGGALKTALSSIPGLQGLLTSLTSLIPNSPVPLDPSVVAAMGTALDGITTTIMARSQVTVLLNTVATSSTAPDLISQLDVVITAYTSLSLLDMSLMTTDDVIAIVQSIHDFIVSLGTVDQAVLAAYPLSNLTDAICAVLNGLDVTGNTDVRLIALIPQLSDIINASILVLLSTYAQETMVDAVTRLENQLVADLILDETDVISSAAAVTLQNGIQAMITTNTLTIASLNALILSVLNIIQNQATESVLGQGTNQQNILQNISSILPLVGPMLQKTINTFLPQSVNDKTKISEAARKHAVAQSFLKKKMDAAKEIFADQTPTAEDVTNKLTDLQKLNAVNTQNANIEQAKASAIAAGNL